MRVSNSLFVLIFCLFTACKGGPFNLLKATSPHHAYERRLLDAGLAESSMGERWLNKAKNLLAQPFSISLPYKETGYFAAEKIEGTSLKFNLVRGQLLHATLSNNALNKMVIYMDLWERKDNGDFAMAAFADSTANLKFEVKKNGEYVLRLQPELLASGAYTLELATGPSLNYPLKAVNRKQIQSFFGAGRDNNSRSHEGIDIFAAFRTPVIAVADGTVSRVNENNLGGKVVWLRPKGKDYTVYYAHLDEQIATSGQEVRLGDTLGLMGNTGNAKTTPPHLHLGIYTGSGAVDPLPFIDPQVLPAPAIKSDINRLNRTLRLNRQTKFEEDGNATLSQNIPVRVLAAAKDLFKVELPNGISGFIKAAYVSESSTLRKINISANKQSLLDYPSPNAAVKSVLPLGTQVNLLGTYEKYQLVSTTDNNVGWIIE